MLRAPDADVQATALLYAQNVTKEFGGLVAVNDISFDIQPQSIVSIIGPNGAGKTTFFNMLTGLYKPTHGRIVFDGRDITPSASGSDHSMGVARTFQNIRLFGAMSALENVMIGRHSRMKGGAVRLDLAHAAGAATRSGSIRERARELLDYVGLRRNAFGACAGAALLRRPAAGRDRPRARRPIRSCCCSTSRPRA